MARSRLATTVGLIGSLLLGACGESPPPERSAAVPIALPPTAPLAPAPRPDPAPSSGPGPVEDAPPPPPEPEPSPGVVSGEARALVMAGERGAARALLTLHLGRNPQDADAHELLGDLAFEDRLWPTADTHLTLAAQGRPDDGDLRLRATLAKQWMSVEDTAAYTRRDLYAGYVAAARLLPEDDRPLRLLVTLYPEEGSPHSVAAMEAVIAAQPRAVRARLRKAQLVRDALPDVALAVLAEAAGIRPDDREVGAEEASVLAAVGRHDAAALRYTGLLSEPGDDTAGISNALDALLHPGDPASPIEAGTRLSAVEALCRSNPDDPRFGNNAGLWYRDEAKDYETSVEFYLRALAIAPDDVDLLSDTAFLYLQHLRDMKEEALPLLEKARRLVEQDGRPATRGYWDALEHLCRAYFEIGRYQEVVACADVRLSPDARVNGRPYPSGVAATWRTRALERMGR